ncbi:tRNA-uridine aminocarboxypropyltransferase [Thalassomonas sp. M1454]|uniref:tRNA-uridine aminocarboxypropyltransferase n=1 Tax=Thalassomonas sp. M1454 TaxID=2594477 RepID=UPI00117FA920|nr:tRNA-uridine aminocarboxypropyltransferase [Thalassomonas sp. M1454]TRX57122.1 DTW domain-containing protein [Thalassomonas sp. M1454]
MHAVQRLFLYRQSLSTTEFRARGYKIIRCEVCRLGVDNCICNLRQQANSHCAFALLMYDNEVLKPSNTGRLIADVIPDTHAFLWHRTEPNTELQQLIADPNYQAFLIFPGEYAHAEQQVYERKPVDFDNSKIPLFILIDATWRQAKKIFRKSDYLAKLPIVTIPALEQTKLENSKVKAPEYKESVEPQNTDDRHSELIYNFDSRYQMRKAEKEGQLATAEVAAKVLDMFGDSDSAMHLDLWFDVFSYRYQQSKSQKNQANSGAINLYKKFIAKS